MAGVPCSRCSRPVSRGARAGGRWLDAGRPALVHFARFNITQAGRCRLRGVALAAVLVSAVQLAVR